MATLDGRVALVTGASSGIDEAAALALVERVVDAPLAEWERMVSLNVTASWGGRTRPSPTCWRQPATRRGE